MGSGSGFRSTLAVEAGWVLATQVGPDREARLAFVSATPSWEVRRSEDGIAEVDESPLRALIDADPGDLFTEAELPDAAYEGIFDAWPEARRAIWRSWMRLTDPANLQPDVKGVLRRAADLVRDSRSSLSQVDRDRVAVSLAQRWPLRISREVGRILDDTGKSDEARVLALRDLVNEEGLQAPHPPRPLPAIDEDDIRLVAWMVVIPTRQSSDRRRNLAALAGQRSEAFRR